MKSGLGIARQIFCCEKFRPTFHEKWGRLVLLGLAHGQSTIHEKWIGLGAAVFVLVRVEICRGDD